MHDPEDVVVEKIVTKKHGRRENIKNNKKYITVRSHGCTRKQAYQTKKIALENAHASTRHAGMTIRVYKCPYCHYYHLTHQVPRKPKTKTI